MCQLFHRRAQSIVLLITVAGVSNGQDRSAVVSDQSGKISAAVQSYQLAFQERNVQALASHWSQQGVYTSRQSGDRIRGREAIAKELEAMFQGDNVPKLTLLTESIDFVSPSVALERGIATVTRGEEDPIQTAYTTVFVKQDGKWLIDRVTEAEIRVKISNQDRLAGLEWLIGQWTDEGDDRTIQMNCQWTRNKNFISRIYKVSSENRVESSGLQIIGWDPVNQQIRSWLFDSEGSFVAGTWKEKGTKWVVQSVATLADGGSGSFTSIFRPLEDGTYAWQKTNRVLDGELLPNVDEVMIQRK